MQDKLTREVEFLQEKQAAFVFTSYEFGDEQAMGTGKIVHAPEFLTYEKALSSTVIFTSTVLIDTEKTGKGLVYMPLVKSEDTALWWKLLKNGFTAYGLDEVLVIYRRPAKSLSSNKLEAIRRIWYLYRKEEKLPLVKSCVCFMLWGEECSETLGIIKEDHRIMAFVCRTFAADWHICIYMDGILLSHHQ